jgi:electron transfer flavoprotein alpha subunit
MKIVVCIRQLSNGEINPFDACAYEAALRIDGAEITLLSMGPPKVADFLTNLTRLGAKRAVLLCDDHFAGADTLATAYTLSLAIEMLDPDLIFCGRQTVDGDTGQVGPELAVMTGRSLVTNVMQLSVSEHSVTCTDRSGKTVCADYPALLTLERINRLRLPRLRSTLGETVVRDAAALGADESRCGLKGSPTRVIKTFENDQDRRKCTFIKANELSDVIDSALKNGRQAPQTSPSSKERLRGVWTVGDAPLDMAKTISDDIATIEMDTPKALAKLIAEKKPTAVLWGDDPVSKAVAPQVAALLRVGLCADCTRLETDSQTLFMYRPAFSGNVIAKIRSLTLPQMATVRTVSSDGSSIVVGIGAGAKDCMQQATALAERLGADTAASRVMVDNDYMPYEKQVGLTGKTVSPDVYLALGISGAVHHIAGIRSSGTVIAVNRDPDAPIFKYADYGVIDDIESILTVL